MSGPGLIDGYRSLRRHAFDEMLGPDGEVRPAWAALAATLESLGTSGLARTRDDAARVLDGDGVVYGQDGLSGAQRWDFDPLPILLEEAEWAALERGLAQRARLLDLLLADLYGPRTVLRGGLLPVEVVLGHSGFVRACDGIRVAGGHQLFTLATDLARASDGTWVVLTDRSASPSGAGFAMENRRVSSRVLPDLYHEARIHRLGPFFQAMRLGLQELAPLTAEAPRIALLTSGPHSETAYDQAFLSQLLGYPLVSGPDLSVRDGRLVLRGLEGPEQVDVLLRRVDSDFCDPLELRPESQLGVPGLIEACRLGSVSVVNSLGSGVLENPGLLPFLPALCRELLGEDLLVPSAPTTWCGSDEGLRRVRDDLDSLVLKPISRGTSHSSFFGWELSVEDRARLVARVEAEPHLWVVQEPVATSTAPTFSGADITTRSMVLRGFTVAQGGRYHVLSGGLVRVAPERDSLLVSSQAGALTKDAWVLTSRRTHVDAPLPFGEPHPPAIRQDVVSPRIAEDFLWLGRYTERAEACVRLLRAVRDRSADFSRGGEPVGEAAVAALFRALTDVTTTYPGFVAGADPTRELWSLVAEPGRAGTLAHSLAGLVRATRAVRDQLSPDTWLMINALDASVRDLAPGPGGELPGDVAVGRELTRILASLLALSGLSAESMVRDLGWHFMECGRRLERSQQVLSLLLATVVDERLEDVDALVAESVLLASESVITYRRRYPTRPEPMSVLDLLLVDGDNPRSVAHAFGRLSGHLGNLPQGEALREPLRELRDRIRLADLPSLVRAVDHDGQRRALASYLRGLLDGVRDLADGLELAYFEDVLAPVPLFEVIA